MKKKIVLTVLLGVLIAIGVYLSFYYSKNIIINVKGLTRVIQNKDNYEINWYNSQVSDYKTMIIYNGLFLLHIIGTLIVEIWVFIKNLQKK